ncbi:MAG: (Fe-S)-binding protein [Longimicrobiales bacterium]|nr:(Fe-S)-binding protein [Longimicrobiales bacterium]
MCPSGVEYGTLLELAREAAAEARPPGMLTRSLLIVMGSRPLRGMLFMGGRLLRATGLAGWAVRHLGGDGVAGKLRFALAMLAATTEAEGFRRRDTAVAGVASATHPSGSVDAESAGTVPDRALDAPGGTVGVLQGCVQDGLYGRLNDATGRTLDANGFHVRIVTRQDCCGALHAHGGDLQSARHLARRNIEAFERAGVDWVVVNAAGCGAAMKDYGVLLEGDPMQARARAFAERVRDVTELLAAVGPRRGAPVTCSVAYDHPCHLMHAQGVTSEPLQVLDAVPGVEVRMVAKADECCGGAGIYGMTHPDLGAHIGGDKVAAVRETGADLACTPNPGCMMQIGAGLRIEGSGGDVVHPVELLDHSYQRAGYYR